MLITALSQTQAKQVSDLTVEVYFSKPMTPYEKSLWSKHENIRELTDTISLVLGKTINVKLVDKAEQSTTTSSPNNDLQKLAEGNDIPFTIT